MNVLTVILLGLGAGAAAGVLGFLAALTRAPVAKARRAGLAAAMGGAIAFTLTALVQLPLYAKAESELTIPLVVAAIAGAAGAILAAGMILRARPLDSYPPDTDI